MINRTKVPVSFVAFQNPLVMFENACMKNKMLYKNKTIVTLTSNFKVLFLTILLDICSERKNFPPESKHVRLCLACQAVKNMFTSGGRSYSVLILALMRRNLPRM